MLSRNVVEITDTLLISLKLNCYAQNIKTITIYLFHLNIVISFSYVKKNQILIHNLMSMYNFALRPHFNQLQSELYPLCPKNSFRTEGI